MAGREADFAQTGDVRPPPKPDGWEASWQEKWRTSRNPVMCEVRQNWTSGGLDGNKSDGFRADR